MIDNAIVADQMHDYDPTQARCHYLNDIDQIPSTILHLDENYCVIDKLPDVCMDGNAAITIEKLVSHWTKRDIKSLKWVHQLDFATSGALCIGLNRSAAAAATYAFEQRLVKKSYLAILIGHLDISQYPVYSSPSTGQGSSDEILSILAHHLLIATNHNPKTKEKRKRTETTSSSNSNPSSSCWQDIVKEQHLQVCLHALHEILTIDQLHNLQAKQATVTAAEATIASPDDGTDPTKHLQSIHPTAKPVLPLLAEYAQLTGYGKADYEKDGKLRKQLKKFLIQRCLIKDLPLMNSEQPLSLQQPQQEQEALPLEQSAEAQAHAAHGPWKDEEEADQAASTQQQQSMPMTLDEVQTLCQLYRDINQHGQQEGKTSSSFNPDSSSYAQQHQPSIYRIPSSSSSSSSSSVDSNYNLLIDIPLIEYPDHFRIDPDPAPLLHLTAIPNQSQSSGRPAGKKAVTELIILDYAYYQPDQPAASTTAVAGGSVRRIPITKVLLKPISGRRHQLRVHSMILGHPILGDYTYSSSHNNNDSSSSMMMIERMMLHAYSLTIPLPIIPSADQQHAPATVAVTANSNVWMKKCYRHLSPEFQAYLQTKYQEQHQQVQQQEEDGNRSDNNLVRLVDVTTVDPFPLVVVCEEEGSNNNKRTEEKDRYRLRLLPHRPVGLQATVATATNTL